ncbi:MAG: glycoside hydrolase family 127 protein, partial [Abditibacteriota bacterium]|nr:glycoside hydrolase family 127 protein [Abditibacteriota bacterium]
DPSLTDIMQENCVSVTWLKYAERLLEITGRARYADAMERTAYNAVLSAVNLPEKEHPFDSYAALLYSWRGRGRGGEKPLSDGGSYGCCECIGSAATGLMPLCAVMTDAEGCRVCFYETGRAELPFGALDISTGYPAEGSVRIRVDSGKSFALRLRIPGWCGSARLLVNGEPAEAEPGWAVIRRQWSEGDLVELEMDMSTRIIAARPGRTEACEKHFALQRGPLVLAGDARAGGDMVRVYRPAEKDGTVPAAPCKNEAFPSLVSLEIAEEGGGSFAVSDYGSCGKTLDEESLMTCWFPVSNYWTPDKRRFYICAGDRYLSPGPEGRLLLSPAKALFEAEPDIAGYHFLRTGDKYLDGFLHAGGEKGRLRLISDLAGRWYIVSRNRFAAPDEQGGAVLAAEPFRWTLEYAE